jgi:NAD(P)-dependent dehydrogenase (short-subunit alcohol dehydrogenase family)
LEILIVKTILNKKVVVVTGGAGLIGRSFVRCIVEHGGIAVVADVNKQTGSEFIDGLKTCDPQARAEFVEVDITSKESLENLITSLHGKHGRIDALVNNAYPRNKNYGRKFEEVTYDDFCQNVSVHLGGYFLAAQQIAGYFKKQGHGSIVNMASIYGVVAPRFGIYEQTKMTMPVEYAAIKSAIIHLTKYMAQYFKSDNIRVNCISPGGILDGQPAEFLLRYNGYAASKGMLDVADLQGTLLYLLSDMSKFVNGQNIVVDDGWSL